MAMSNVLINIHQFKIHCTQFAARQMPLLWQRFLTRLHEVRHLGACPHSGAFNKLKLFSPHRTHFAQGQMLSLTRGSHMAPPGHILGRMPFSGRLPLLSTRFKYPSGGTGSRCSDSGQIRESHVHVRIVPKHW